MDQLYRYVETFHLGNVHNPHTGRREMLTEMVTVCPACGSLRSLRHEGKMVSCVNCLWMTPAIEQTEAA